MTASEARRRAHHAERSILRERIDSNQSSSKDTMSSDGDGNTEDPAVESGKRQTKRNGAQSNRAMLWILPSLLGASGLALFVWHLASEYIYSPRVLHPKHLEAENVHHDFPPCHLKNGFIVPAQGPCSIQEYLDSTVYQLSQEGRVRYNSHGAALAEPVPDTEIGQAKVQFEENLHSPVSIAARNLHPGVERQTPEMGMSKVERQDLEGRPVTVEKMQNSAELGSSVFRSSSPVPPWQQHMQTEREKRAQRRWEERERRQEEAEIAFAEREKIHREFNRKREERGIPPLPPLRAPWEILRTDQIIPPSKPPSQQHIKPGQGNDPRIDPRGAPEMTASDFAWISGMSIVISWVNGSDPEYAKIRAKSGRDKLNTSRDRDSGELLHALQSIERYMAWHTGKLFIVSPNQTPSWLDTAHPRVHMINQDDIVPKECLPMFSSNVLEQYLHRIPGLTETFIYWNDDYFLGRSVLPGDFIRFDKNGPRRLMLYMLPGRIGGGAEKVQDAAKGPRKWYATLYKTNGVLNEAYGGVDPGRTHIAHAPYVLHKGAYEKIHEKWRNELNHTCHNKFRHWSDVLFPYLHHYYVIHEGSKCCGIHYQIKTFKPDAKDEFMFYILGNDKEKNNKTLNVIRMLRPKFFTLNDGFKNPSVGYDQLTPFLANMSNGFKSTFEHAGQTDRLSDRGQGYNAYIQRAKLMARRPEVPVDDHDNIGLAERQHGDLAKGNANEARRRQHPSTDHYRRNRSNTTDFVINNTVIPAPGRHLSDIKITYKKRMQDQQQ